MSFKKTAITLIVIVFVFGAGYFAIGGFKQQAQSKGLVGHWSLAQEDLKSSTVIADKTPYSNDGTITPGASAGFVTDQKGQPSKAYDFDGADTKIDTGADMVGVGADSVSAWIYLNGWGEHVNGLGRIIDNGMALLLVNKDYSGAGVDNLVFTSDSSTIAVSANNSLSLNRWYHVVVTRDATGANTNLYINGVLSGTTNQDSGTPIVGSNNIFIGNRFTSALTFDGKISDIRIYNYALTAEEISQLYDDYKPQTKQQSNSKGLVGHWGMAQKDLKDSDTFGDLTPYGNDGDSVNAPTFKADRKARPNKAMSFNGSSDKVSTTFDLSGETSVSFNFWAKWIDTSNRFDIFTQGDDANNRIKFVFSSSNAYFVVANAGNANVNTSFTSTDWTMWTLVFDGSQSTDQTRAKIYKNGVLQSTTLSNSIPTSLPSMTNLLEMGYDTTTSNYGKGYLSDFRVYDYALSLEEIAQVYDNYNPSLKLQSLSRGLVGNWSLAQKDLKSSTVVADLTPYSNDGTITAGASIGFVTDQKGQPAKAYDFDGADTKIDTGSDWIDVQPITISAWIYANSYGETAGRIVDNGKTEFMIRDSLGTEKILRFISDGSTAVESPANSILINTWYYVVVTRDSTGANTNFYINGVLSGTANQDSGTPAVGTTNVIIGNNNGQTKTFDGLLSDVRIYNRVLSAEEIMALYESY